MFLSEVMLAHRPRTCSGAVASIIELTIVAPRDRWCGVPSPPLSPSPPRQGATLRHELAMAASEHTPSAFEPATQGPKLELGLSLEVIQAFKAY